MKNIYNHVYIYANREIQSGGYIHGRVEQGRTIEEIKEQKVL